MKTTNNILKFAATAIALAVVLFITGCAKEEDTQAPSEAHEPEKLITNPRVIAEIDKNTQEMPAIAWYNSTMDKVIIFDPKKETKNFDFVDPALINFVSTLENVFAIALIYGTSSDFNQRAWVEFVSNGAPNFGSTGGMVVAGNTALNIAYTTFFRANQESENDLFHIGGFNTPTQSDAQMAIGIDGDMEALTTGDFQNDAEIYQYFRGLVFCIVYANAALGNYAFADWFDYLYQSNSYLQNMAFVWIYAFTVQSWSIFFSQVGILNLVNGGLNFNGKFYGAQLNHEALDESESGSGNEIKYMENIHGSGELRE